ncbi:Hint domain-containing protein, partial [Amycolatopsis samaneae]
EAQQAAAEAATDGAAARAAAARANQADAQAHDDAVKARRAANQANSDAAIAGRAASAAEGEAAAARSAASRAESDAAAARGAADRAEADATAANAAAESAQRHADNAATAAKNAMNAAIEAGKAADRAEEAQRQREAEKRKQQAAGSGANDPGISDEEEEMILYSEGGDELVQQYKDALGAANKGILDFIKENGADVLLDIIGVTDAKKCFGEGDIVSCLWTVVNAGSLLALVVKLPQVGAAIVKIAGGVTKFLEASAAGTKILEKTRELLGKLRIICNCFPAGTMVATAHGEKPIEQIKVGDRVWARDLTSGHSQLRGVVGLFNKHADELLTVAVGATTLEVTPQHPFWVIDRGWVTAGDLRLGERLQSLRGDQPVISSITRRVVQTTVYNFEVEGDHNYYITDAQLLVHNCSVNQMNKKIQTGGAPSGVTRVDKGKIPGEQTHVHFSDGTALNKDGTWKHDGGAGGPGKLTNAQKKWLRECGWKLPLDA